MDLEFDEALTRGLHRYAALVAEGLGLTGECWSVQLESPATVYLALDRHLPEFPNRDTALIWEEGTGWSLVVESPGAEEMRTVARLRGDLLPSPQVVARFAGNATDSGEYGRPADPVPPRDTAPGHDDLVTRLAGYARRRRGPAELLTVSVEHGAGTVVVSPAGEIDMSTAPRLAEAIDEALGERPGVLVVDLSGVRFLGSAGLGVLARAHQRAGPRTQVRIVAADRRTLAPLEITGLAATMSIHPTLRAALEVGLGRTAR